MKRKENQRFIRMGWRGQASAWPRQTDLLHHREAGINDIPDTALSIRSAGLGEVLRVIDATLTRHTGHGVVTMSAHHIDGLTRGHSTLSFLVVSNCVGRNLNPTVNVSVVGFEHAGTVVHLIGHFPIGE